MANKARTASAAKNVAETGLFVAMIAVCAQIAVPLGSVPFTLQTLAVALVSAVAGIKRGVAAVAVYVLMGLFGLPVFAGLKGGYAALAGPTGGYITGFVLMAAITGVSRSVPVKNFYARTALTFAFSVVGLAACYVFGTGWFAISFGCGVSYALSVCVLPYIIPDLFKLALASVISSKLIRSSIV